MLINDSTSTSITHPTDFGRGCIPPDYAMHPDFRPLLKLQPSSLSLIPQSEWSARIKEKNALKSHLSNIRRTSGPNGGVIPSLNQGQVGYCWAHSSSMGQMLLRAIMGQPYVKLSAFMVASIIKSGRDEGGWGALSLDFIEKNGQCTQAEWPEGSRDLSLDTSSMRTVAAKHKVTGDWADLQAEMWDRTMAFNAVATLLLSNVPVICDFNWWGHSVIAMDLVEVEPGSFGVKILNSWGDEWGDVGEGVLQGSKAVPDGAVAPMVAMAV